MSVEKEIFKGWGVRASYIGNKGTQLAYMFDANQTVISSEGFDQSRRPYPAFQSITRIENGANSRYNALQFVENHPFSNGLFLQVSYTAQRARNDVGERGTSGSVRDTAPELPIVIRTIGLATPAGDSGPRTTSSRTETTISRSERDGDGCPVKTTLGRKCSLSLPPTGA
jgi:hypothetical protein